VQAFNYLTFFIVSEVIKDQKSQLYKLAGFINKKSKKDYNLTE
jgi:hypothetical protein